MNINFCFFERHPDGVLLITIYRPDVLNATNAPPPLGAGPRCGRDIDDDPETNVVRHHGKGRASRPAATST